MRSIACWLTFAATITAALSASAQQPPQAPPGAAPIPASPPPWGAGPAPYPSYPPYPPYPPYAMPPQAMWATVPVEHERRSQGLWITGVVLWGTGGATTLAGLGLVVNAIASPCINIVDFMSGRISSSSAREPIGVARQAIGGCDNSGTVGIVLATVGFGLGLAGIPFFVVGNQRVKPQPSAIPTLRPGLGGGDLRWVF